MNKHLMAFAVIASTVLGLNTTQADEKKFTRPAADGFFIIFDRPSYSDHSLSFYKIDHLVERDVLMLLELDISIDEAILLYQSDFIDKQSLVAYVTICEMTETYGGVTTTSLGSGR